MIKTARTYLRDFELDDASHVLRVFSDPRAMAFAPMLPTTELSAAQDFIRWHRENYRLHGFSARVVIAADTDEFIGQAGLIPHDQGVEIFYALLPQFWNRGIATEVALACRDFAFSELQLPRLISIIHPDNERAIRVAQKIGMQQKGLIRYWDRDNALYEIENQPDQPRP